MEQTNLPFENVEWEDYNSIRDAATKLKLRAPSIKKVLNKVIEFTGGYTFEWVNDVIWVKKKKNYPDHRVYLKSYEKLQLVELHCLFRNKWSKILRVGNFESTTTEAKLRDWIRANHPSRYKASFAKSYHATKTCVCCGEREEIDYQLHVCKPAKSCKNKDLGAYLFTFRNAVLLY